MNAVTPLPATEKASATTVHVALIGVCMPSRAALHAALEARPAAGSGVWDVRNVEAGHGSAPVEIALCDGPAGARTSRAAWPTADIVALVPARDDGTATIAALQAGAQVCIRGSEPTLVAAYLRSIARRRDLAAEGGPR